MVRVVILLALCGCDALFEIADPPVIAVDAPAVDASGPTPIARYLMDDLGSGATCMHDSIGGNDGTCVRGMPTIIPGRHGNGYAFDGSTYITVPGVAEPTPPPAFTITVWLELLHDLSESHECPINRLYSTGSTDSWDVCVSSGVIYFIVGDGQEAGDGTSMKPNEWHHVALTYADGMFQGWLDGKPEGLTAATVFFDAQPMVIGLDLDAGMTPNSNYLDGIDELTIYNGALDGTTIAMLAQM